MLKLKDNVGVTVLVFLHQETLTISTIETLRECAKFKLNHLRYY